MKINILSSSRFHLLDLARELDKLDFDVKFYSYIPSWRAAGFGLPKKCCSSIYWFIALFAVFERKMFPRNRWIRNSLKVYQDLLTSMIVRKADVTIALSGNFQRSIDKAKKRGELIVVERGSKHILEQKKILESIPANHGKIIVDKTAVNRELHDYEMVDFISVATEHVKRSFLLHGYPEKKLFVNPYGVDLSHFAPSSLKDRKYDLLMVGNWCFRKGCDLIEKAVETCGLKLLHVGNVGDLLFPKSKLFTHIDAVEQSKLPSYYNQAKVFILPSREEGLAMVQIQAIACNLPLIGSPDSGAEDLKEIVTDSQYIRIIKDYTVDSVIEAIKASLLSYERLGDQLYAGDALRNLTWEAYGKRYASFLESQILS